jgi:hypothetical protein
MATLGLFELSARYPNTDSMVQLTLNHHLDSMFVSLDDFEKNDSLVFNSGNDAKEYRLVNYELRLLARPKDLYHTVIRNTILPKSDIRRYYNNAENTVSVFFSDIRIESVKDHHISRAKAIKFKILKNKSN